MKTMTLITASLLGLATMGGSAFAASSNDMSSEHVKMRHAHHAARTMPVERQRTSATGMARGTYGAPRQQVLADRNSTQPAGSQQLVIPGSDTAIYSYSPTDKNAHYGY